MANVIKKIRANYDTGTEYQVLHYETQAEQVKILDASGAVTSNLKEMILDGKAVTGVELGTLVESGKYQVKNCTEMPTGMSTTETYILEVSKIPISGTVTIVRQDFYDHINYNLHQRFIVNGAKKPWVGIGQLTVNAIAGIHEDISSLEGSLNTLSTTVGGHTTDIANANKDIDTLEQNLANHNHDARYLRQSGGSVTGDVAMSNSKSFAGKNTSGGNLNIGKINGTNDVVVGDVTAKMILQAKSGDLTLTDGTNTYKVFHSGNDGSSSGLDADLLDGKHATSFARSDANSYFKENQTIDDGKSLFLRAPSGSNATGNIYWRTNDDKTKAKIQVENDNTMKLFTGDIVALEVQPSGHTQTTHDHILNAKERQVAVRFVLDDNDKGAGFYINNGTKQVGFYDWQYGGVIFRTDREDQTVKFENEIFIQGHKLSIQSSAPSSPKTGDIWIDI